jgi:hypothetical protein
MDDDLGAERENASLTRTRQQGVDRAVGLGRTGNGPVGQVFRPNERGS